MTSESDSATVLVNTVEFNKYKYSNRDYLCALNTRKLQNMIYRTSYDQFRQIVKNNMLPNFSYTMDNVDVAEDIFGKSLQCLKGKNARKRTVHVQAAVTSLSREILAY